MPETLLQTKLYIPPLRPNLVPRLYLIEQLNQGLQLGHKLTLVSAPAGFGKTTLISSWLHQLEEPVAWLSLDEGDNEPHGFVFYLVAALQEAYNGLGESVCALLQSPQPPPAETLLILLINDLTRLTGQIVLVLDDYHVIRELEIHKAISFLLANQPTQLHLVIISRSDPTFPLHRLRGSGQMKGIYAHDLRFTNKETASFLNETMHLNLSPEEIATFSRRTEGWVAGLQLAALSMQEMQDPGQFTDIFAGDDRYISDYLIGEVFERQPAHIQEFLLKTAILDRFSAPLCDAMIGVGGEGWLAGTQAMSGQAIIDRLDQANLFIIPLDNRREWYRYHHLFADFLRLRLRRWPESETVTLHRRAASWLEDNGKLAEAIDHALTGADYERASRLIEQNAMTTIWGHAQWNTLVDWVGKLPVEVVRSRPRLNMQYAWALFTTGRWHAVPPVLEAIETGINDDREEREIRLLQGEMETLRAWLAFEVDDMEQCISLANSALESLPEHMLMIRSMAILALGAAQLWLGRLPESQRTLEKAVEAGLAAGNMAVTLVAMGCQVQTEVMQGRLRRAADLYKRAREQGTIGGIALLSPAGYACTQMGEVLREWNQLQEAKRLLKEATQLSRQAGAPEDAIEGQIILARVLLAAGEEAAAAEKVAQAEADLIDWVNLGGDLRYSGIMPALVQRARYWLATGELMKVAAWLDEYGIQANEESTAESDARYLLLVRVLLARGSVAEAKRLLGRQQSLLEGKQGLNAQIEALILGSISSQIHGEHDEAVRSLSQALLLAEPEGYRRLFLDEGQRLAELLAEIVRNEGTITYAGAILDDILYERRSRIEPSIGHSGGPATAAQEAAQIGLIEPLTEQELRILRLLSAGLSNREIAAELFLSINTIKTYTSRIYGKLAVHSRAEAVGRAQELSLL